MRSECDIADRAPESIAAMTLPPRSRCASQPIERNCWIIHSARFPSRNVGAPIRQSCKCCSLIQCRSRANH